VRRASETLQGRQLAGSLVIYENLPTGLNQVLTHFVFKALLADECLLMSLCAAAFDLYDVTLSENWRAISARSGNLVDFEVFSFLSAKSNAVRSVPALRSSVK